MLLSKLTRLTKYVAATSKRGWIGVDVGSRLIKVAQIERHGASYRIASRWVIGSEESPILDREALSRGFDERVQQIQAIRGMFHGRTAAATLPMSCVEMRALELPAVSPQELRQIARQEMASERDAFEETCECDVWQAASTGETFQVIALAADRAVSTQLGQDLLAAGLECAVLDGAPCAIARAIELCDPAAANEPVAALDLGETTTLLTIAEQGRPAFCRILRNCGLEGLTKRLQEKLQISRAECRPLLTHLGLSGKREAGAGAVASQIVRHQFEHLVQELHRTFQFVEQQSPQLMPTRLWLLGGGATIRNLPGYLEDEISLPAAPWRLTSSGDNGESDSDPLFAAAAGLSALGWEDSICT